MLNMKEPLIKTFYFQEKRADGTIYFFAKVAIAIKKNFFNKHIWKNYTVYQTDRYSHYLSEETRFSVYKKDESLELTKRKTEEAVKNWLECYLKYKVISTKPI